MRVSPKVTQHLSGRTGLGPGLLPPWRRSSDFEELAHSRVWPLPLSEGGGQRWSPTPWSDASKMLRVCRAASACKTTERASLQPSASPRQFTGNHPCSRQHLERIGTPKSREGQDLRVEGHKVSMEQTSPLCLWNCRFTGDGDGEHPSGHPGQVVARVGAFPGAPPGC